MAQPQPQSIRDAPRTLAAGLTASGNALLSAGDYEGAIADFDHAVSLDPDYAVAYGNRGLAKAERMDYEGAIADYDRAIALDPNYATAYNNRGFAKAERMDYNGAIADYDRAIALNPNDAAAYNARGLAKRYKGDNDGAIADYDRAIALNPHGMSSPAATIEVAADWFNAGHMQEGARLVYVAAFAAVADAAARWNIPCRNDHEARNFLLRLEGFAPDHLDWNNDFDINTPIRAPRYMAAFDVASSFKEHADIPLAQQAKDPIRYWEPAHYATFVPPVRELIEALNLVNPAEVNIWTPQPTSEKHAIT